MTTLTGKTALVTGSTSGIGLHQLHAANGAANQVHGFRLDQR